MPTRVCSRSDSEPSDGLDERKTSLHCTLGVIFVRSWVAEIGKYPVAHVPSDEAIEATDDLGDTLLICANHRSQVFRVHARGERRRGNKIAEQYRELPPIGR